MYDLTSFAVLAGSFCLGAVVMVGWVFRTTSAPFALKLWLPAMLAVLAVETPFSIGAMMGYPVETRLAGLPDNARLIAFVEYDRQSKVDLWLQERGQPPRAWRIDEVLSDRQSLAQAKQQIAHGEPVYVQRGMGAEGQHFTIMGLELPNKE
jgi:hypothetical protein